MTGPTTWICGAHTGRPADRFSNNRRLTLISSRWIFFRQGREPHVRLYQNFHLTNSSVAGNNALRASIEPEPNARGARPRQVRIIQTSVPQDSAYRPHCARCQQLHKVSRVRHTTAPTTYLTEHAHTHAQHTHTHTHHGHSKIGICASFVLFQREGLTVLLTVCGE